LTKSPNICLLINRLNTLSGWFVSNIMRIENLKERVLYLKHVLQIANELRVLQNYNGMNAIISSLNNNAVFRLKKTFDQFTKKESQTFIELKDLVSNLSNYKKHRESIEFVTSGCIPYLGMFLTDLTFIEDGMKNTTKNGLINFKKRTLISKVILKIRSLQNVPYNFKVVPELYYPLFNCENIIEDENELFNLSLTLEPREKK
jgi:son of sevenless